jgi:hypothetical protein
MYYHLDHLTVVQNGLGDVIKIGDLRAERAWHGQAAARQREGVRPHAIRRP